MLSLPSGRCVRDAIVGVVILFLVSVLANTALFRIARSERIEALHDQLRAHAKLAARWLDAEAHARLSSPNQTGSPEHLRSLDILQSLRDVHRTLDDLYSGRFADDGTCKVILETLPQRPEPFLPSTVGRPMDLSPELQKDLGAAILGRMPQKMTKPETGQEGLGVIAPFGWQGDFIVASISARSVNERLAVLRSAYAVAVSLSAIMAVVGGLVIYWLRRREARARLMRPEDREFFRNITSVLPGLLYQARVSPRGKVVTTYVSDAARWTFELEPAALIPSPRPAFARIHPRDRKRLLRAMGSAAWNPGELREEFRVLLPKTGERWLFAISHVQRLPDGSTLWNGFITDVTWRKKAEESLRKSEAGLKAAQTVSGMGSWELELADIRGVERKTQSWSDECYRVFGFEPGTVTLTNEFFFQCVHPDDRENVRSAMDHAITQRARYSIDHRIIRPDGSIRLVHEDAIILHDEKDTRSVIMLGTVRDITEEREREERIRLNEQRLQLATHAGGVGTWDFDVPAKKIVWNAVMYRLKKVDPATFDPNTSSSLDLVHPDDRQRIREEFRRCLASDATSYEVECRLILPDGDQRHTQTSAVIIRDEKGKPIRVVGIEIDVTPQKRAVESALAADRAKSEFLAMMSHEIRTPMNGVLGFTALLKEGALTPQQRDYVETIEASGNNLLHLINDILDLSKVESGQIELKNSSFSLRNFLQEITILLRPRANEKRLEYGWEIAPGVPEAIETDRTRLGQILTNLLGNAVKFTSLGRVWLDASATPAPDGRWTLHLIITDTGLGIPRDSLQRVFEPFYQTDLSASRKHGGTGLGLPISQRLARLMGGDITVTSSPGKGSIFTVTVVVGEGRVLQALDFLPRRTTDLSRFAGRRVLVVDDDAVNRRLCLLQMAKLGLEVEAAEGGAKAVQLCHEKRFAAIIMDVQMPTMDGLEATRRIRESETIRTPIIAFTANVMPDDREKCLAAGMDDYLSKPLQVDDLAAALARWM